MAGNDVLMSVFRARPWLFAGTLRWSNFQRRYRFPLPAGIALLLAAGASLTLPITGHLLEAVAQNPFGLFASLAAACAIATAHRHTRIRRSLVDSWLAPLSAPPSVFLRMLLPPLLQLLLVTAAIAIVFASGTVSWEGAKTVWLTVGSSYLVGSLIGWFSHGDKTAAAPAFHYVTVRRPRESWVQAPRLEPLSYWAIGHARVVSKPKVAAKIALLVLLALPMGSSNRIGQEALAAAAAGWVLLYVAALFVGTVSVAFKAARWLAPTALRYGPFARMLGYRTLLAQLWVWGWVVFLCYAAGLPGALRTGLPLAVLFPVLSCVVTLVTSAIAMKSVGMR